MNLVNKQVIEIDGKFYQYDAQDKCLTIVKGMNDINTPLNVVPSVICGVCNNTSFTISYGNYECLAHCSCGNVMSIYSG